MDSKPQTSAFNSDARIKAVAKQDTQTLERSLAMTHLEMQHSGVPLMEIAARSLVYAVGVCLLEENPKDQQDLLGDMLSYAIALAREVWKRRGDDLQLMVVEEREQDGDTPQQVRRVEEPTH